jgi:hypothetical protein
MKIIILILSLSIMSCISNLSDNSDKINKILLPIGATNIIHKGNGWIIFELNGKTFLFHQLTHPYQGYESITQIK